MGRETPPGHVFVGSLAEINRRKVAEVVCGSRDKNNASATHFFALSPKPIVRFRWKRARLSLFRPQPHLPNLIQIHPSFQDLLAKTTFHIITIIAIRSDIGSPIMTQANTPKYSRLTRRSRLQCATTLRFRVSFYTMEKIMTSLVMP